MKKLIVTGLILHSVLVCLAGSLGADQAGIILGEDGKAYVVPIGDVQTTPPDKPAVDSALKIASLPNPWPQGYIYYTLPAGPLGSIDFITPWSAAILAQGYDFIGHQSLTQGYVPLGQIWKITMVVGGGVNAQGEGSPLGGGILNIVNAKLAPEADFHVAVTGGYNVNQRQAMAVLSGSVQFLK